MNVHNMFAQHTPDTRAEASHDNSVFHSADHGLRINALFPAQRFNRVVELSCHGNTDVGSIIPLL
jgi:hypothetical protein